MDTELFRFNKLVRRFDRDLSARRSIHGVIQICQKKRRWDAFDLDGQIIRYAYDDLSPVFGLTHNWSSFGDGVSWGVLPVLAKLNEISLSRRDELRRELEKERDRLDEEKRRDRMNKFEGIAEETHAVYKEALKDVNTSSMDKTKDPRRKFDRSIRYGNSK